MLYYYQIVFLPWKPSC